MKPPSYYERRCRQCAMRFLAYLAATFVLLVMCAICVVAVDAYTAIGIGVAATMHAYLAVVAWSDGRRYALRAEEEAHHQPREIKL